LNDVAFIVHRPSVASAKVRGSQIAGRLGAALLRLDELTPDTARRYRTLVYVKELPPKDLMARLRDGGALQVFDPVDNYRWRTMRARAPFIDHFIASNHTHAVELTRRFAAPATRVPHHHCNFDEVRIPAGREPATLGYVGGRVNWPPVRRLIRSLPYPHIAHTSGEKTLVDAYCSIDVGVAWRMEEGKISYNSGVKLINFMSFGIPSVLAPETGYLELSRHGECCLYAHSREEYTMLVRELAGSPALRRRMGDEGFENARRYHIRHIVEEYRALLESLPR